MKVAIVSSHTITRRRFSSLSSSETSRSFEANKQRGEVETPKRDGGHEAHLPPQAARQVGQDEGRRRQEVFAPAPAEPRRRLHHRVERRRQEPARLRRQPGALAGAPPPPHPGTRRRDDARDRRDGAVVRGRAGGCRAPARGELRLREPRRRVVRGDLARSRRRPSLRGGARAEPPRYQREPRQRRRAGPPGQDATGDQ